MYTGRRRITFLCIITNQSGLGHMMLYAVRKRIAYATLFELRA